jgi:hypothetical protein
MKIFVDMEDVVGSVNTISGYSQEQLKCIIMTSWIYWEIVSKNT